MAGRGGVARGIGAAAMLLAGLPAGAQQLDTANLVPCAREGEVCRMPHPTNVYFGVPGRTHGRPFPQGGSVPCNNQSFGDPAPGQAKRCWYAPKVAARRGGDPRDAYERGGASDRRGYGRDEREVYRDERDDDRPRRRSYDDDRGSERRRDRGYSDGY